MTKTINLSATAVFSLLAFCIPIADASAQSASGNIDAPPIVKYLLSHGVKLTYLGEEGGVKGYLGESSSGFYQTFYLTPDGNHVIAGILNDTKGINVTGVQIGEMRTRFQSAMESVQSSPDSSDLLFDSKSVPSENLQGEETGANETGPDHISELPKPLSQVAVSKETEIRQSSDNLLGPLEKFKFLLHAKQAEFFEIGSSSAPDVVWKFADPNCQFCHMAWTQLTKFIESERIRVRIVPIAFLPDSANDVRNLLASPNPERIWLETDAGALPIGLPESTEEQFKKAEEKLRRNMGIVRKLDIQGTPFLVVEDSEGNVRTSQGVPDNMELFLTGASQ